MATKKAKTEIVNGNLTCADCGSTKFTINTTHSVENGVVGRITLTEIECAGCAISQMEIDGAPDVPERERQFFKSTTAKDRAEE